MPIWDGTHTTVRSSLDSVTCMKMDCNRAGLLIELPDTVRHSTLFEKLINVQIQDNIYNWMVNFFAGHSHCTRLGQDISDYRDISASVIQGSAIGPASFVVNAADLRPLTKENRLMKYADDTYLIVPAMNAASCTKELDNIQSWATANNLTLNRAKSKLIIFANPHRRRVHSDLDLLATTDGIPRVNAIKILGATITDNFSMTDHVAAVITSCAHNLYALRTLGYVHMACRRPNS